MDFASLVQQFGIGTALKLLPMLSSSPMNWPGGSSGGQSILPHFLNMLLGGQQGPAGGGFNSPAPSPQGGQGWNFNSTQAGWNPGLQQNWSPPTTVPGATGGSFADPTAVAAYSQAPPPGMMVDPRVQGGRAAFGTKRPPGPGQSGFDPHSQFWNGFFGGDIGAH